ncbi:Uncharacterized protein C56G2.3 [Toxocara canis]|uniref:Uncharacterized protein C56G2.3 n=1 Tax=Toxocara canis TaxID=6265 RepID=A0A0B2VXZ2_TOXCA|nr:Uncharacterized protein C56G2.3 [Toxocara canis]
MQQKLLRKCFLTAVSVGPSIASLPVQKVSGVRWQQRSSSAPHASKVNVNLNLPADVLPSREFVVALKRNYERDKLARLLSEMEVLYEISTEVPRALSDDDWHFYLNLQDVNERERFLSRTYFEQLNAARIAQQQAECDVMRRKIREEQQIRHNRGEMVYAPGFHTYFDIRGQYFRKAEREQQGCNPASQLSDHKRNFILRILLRQPIVSELVDCMYGSYLLAAQRCDEMPPQLIVDCRFLHQLSDRYQSRFLSQIQRLHDANWFSRCPFPVSIVNLLADDRLARYIKRYWLFLCGPKRVHGGEDEDDFSQLYNELDAYSDSGSERSNSDSSTSEEEGFTPHPFIPTISSRSIRDNLNKDVRDEEVVYISGSAPRLLDGPLTNYKAVVICTSYDFQPWSSSLSAARADRLTPFRIPLDRYVKWERGQKVMPVDVTANIIRTVYSNDGDWKSAILENVPEYHFTKDRPTSKRHERSAINIERLNRLKALEEAMLEMDRRRIDALEKSKPRKAFANEQPGSRKRIYEHRYSREERRARTGSQKPS